MEKDFPPALITLAGAFARNGFEARLVGGAVRDLVMGKQPKDWDMATNALPHQTMKVLEEVGKPFDMSNGHGTVSVVLDGETYEVTTLRVDAETDGRHAQVVFVEDFKLDAGRRDFTMNAMSMDVLTGEVFDYFHGQYHLQMNTLQWVGDADARMQEDYLRMLRYFRFAGRYSMHMTENDLNAVKRNVAGLKKVSGERFAMEMDKILTGPNAALMMKVMQETGVLDVVFFRD